MKIDQIKQATKMHEAGITWALIANHFKVDPATLRKHIKNYEKNSEQIL